MPVINYDRPLFPGTVRISRGNGGAVTIALAPDTAKRTLYTLTRPLLVAAIFCIIPLAMFENSLFPPAASFIVFATIGLVAALCCYRVVALSGQPIVFHADSTGLQVTNPLDRPAVRFHDADQIVALQLRRISLLTQPVCYQLELIVRAFMRDSEEQSLLVSQSAETLDKIGRTLCKALVLPEPLGDTTTWICSRDQQPAQALAR